MNRKKFAAGDIVRANQLVNILKNNNIKTNSINIARSANLYGIKKADKGGYYIEPSKEELKKIKKEYDLNLLKQGQSEPAQKLFKEKIEKASELLKQGKTQSEVQRILSKEYKINLGQGTRGFIATAAKELEKKGFKIKSGREAEQGLSKKIQNTLKEYYPNVNFEFDKYKYGISPNSPKYSSVKNAAGGFQEYLKERGKNIQEVSKLSVENKMNEAKRILSKQLGFIEEGKTTLDLAHRSSLKQNKELGLNYLSSNLGIDPKDINRRIIKPVEDELKTLYKQQTKLVDQAKKFESVPEEIQKKLSDVNFKISEVIATTDGRLQGIHVDEKTLQPKRTGIDYSKSVDLGIFDKPVKDLSKQEIEFINKFLLPEAMKAQNISKIVPKELYSKVIPGQETVFDYLKSIASDVKAGKILSPTLKVLAPVGTAIGAYDVAQSYAEGKPLPETAGAFLGVDPIIEAIREESRLTPEASEIKKRIRTEELEGREYTPGLDVLPPSDGIPVTETEKQKVAAEEEQIKKQLEEERLSTKEERGKILDYLKGRFSPIAEEERIEMKDGGFVEFGDPETWKERAFQFINRPIHTRSAEKNKSAMFGKYASQIAETRLRPEDSLSKYKSYSEEELLGNIEAKQPNQLQSFSLEDYQLNTMPVISPKEIVPKNSIPVTPNIYNERREGILELAMGGRVNFQGGGRLKLPLMALRKIDNVLLQLKNNLFISSMKEKSEGKNEAIKWTTENWIGLKESPKDNIFKQVEDLKQTLPKEYHSTLEDIKNLTDKTEYIKAKQTLDALDDVIDPNLKFSNLPKDQFPMTDPLNDAFVITDPKSGIMESRYVTSMSIDPETGRGIRQTFDRWDPENKVMIKDRNQWKLKGVESIEKGKEGLN